MHMALALNLRSEIVNACCCKCFLFGALALGILGSDRFSDSWAGFPDC
jgi:hypothetical protein